MPNAAVEVVATVGVEQTIAMAAVAIEAAEGQHVMDALDAADDEHAADFVEYAAVDFAEYVADVECDPDAVSVTMMEVAAVDQYKFHCESMDYQQNLVPDFQLLNY